MTLDIICYLRSKVIKTLMFVGVEHVKQRKIYNHILLQLWGTFQSQGCSSILIGKLKKLILKLFLGHGVNFCDLFFEKYSFWQGNLFKIHFYILISIAFFNCICVYKSVQQGRLVH